MGKKDLMEAQRHTLQMFSKGIHRRCFIGDNQVISRNIPGTKVEIAKERGGLNGLINLDITKDDISDILEESGFKGYRFDGALKWILKTIQIIKELEKVL